MEQKTKLIHIRVPKWLWEIVEKSAASQGESVSSEIRRALIARYAGFASKDSATIPKDLEVR